MIHSKMTQIDKFKLIDKLVENVTPKEFMDYLAHNYIWFFRGIK
jgi:hypothetical protein